MRGLRVAIFAAAGVVALLCFASRIGLDWNKSRMYGQETLGPSGSNLISASLAGGEKQGYKFTNGNGGRLQHSSCPDGLRLDRLAHLLRRPIAGHPPELLP